MCTAKKKECERAVLKAAKYTKKKNLVYRRFKCGDDIFDTRTHNLADVSSSSHVFTLRDQLVVANSRERVCFGNKFWLPVLIHQTHNLSRIEFAHISWPVDTVEGLCISWSSVEVHRMKPSMLWQMQPWIWMKKQQELPLATMYVKPMTTHITICNYHEEEKKKINADCFASAL